MNSSTPLRITDSCVGAHCNPTCPDELVFIDPGDAWEDLVKYIVIGLSLVLTVFCSILKAVFMGYYAYLVKCQRKYLADSEAATAPREVSSAA